MFRFDFLGRPALYEESEDARPTTDRPYRLSENDAALLALLLMGGPRSSSSVAAMIWLDEGTAMNNLRQRIFRLRTRTQGYLFTTGATLSAAADLRCDRAPSIPLLETDPAAHAGEWLGGFKYERQNELRNVLDGYRDEWHRALQRSLASLADRAESGREYARALVYAERCLSCEPCEEAAYYRIIRLQYLSGDAAAGLATFRKCRHMLKATFDAEPSDETRRLAETLTRSRAPKTAESVRIHAMPVALQKPPRTVGRDRIASRLLEAHRDGASVWIVGEAGIGKSRLLDDFVHAKTAGDEPVVALRAHPRDEWLPYRLMERVLRAMRPTGSSVAPLEDAFARARPTTQASWSMPGHEKTSHAPGWALESARDAFRKAAAAIRRPITIVLDDLHGADAFSLDLLDYLSTELPATEVRWVMASRPIDAVGSDVVGRDGVLRRLAGSKRMVMVALGPLDTNDLEVLVAELDLAEIDAARWAAALMKHGGGNPFHALETLRSAWMSFEEGCRTPPPTLPLADGLMQIIQRRLSCLSSGALELARLAAIAVPDFRAELVESIFGRPAIGWSDAWRELEEAHVLQGVEFAHDLMHECVLRSMPATLRSHAHRQVAAALAEREADSERIAAHWDAGDRPSEAACFWKAAADRAYAAGLLQQAARMLERAAHSAERAGDPEAVVRRRLEMADVLNRSVGSEAALRALEGAHAETGAPPELVAQVFIARSEASAWLHRGDDAERDAMTAGRLLAESNVTEPALRLRLAAALAIAKAINGDAAQGCELLLPWLGRLDEPPLRALRTKVRSDAANLLLLESRDREALPLVRQQLAALRGGDRDPAEEVEHLMNLTAIHNRQGELSEARDLALEAEALIRDQAEMALLCAWNRIHVGMLEASVGHYGSALKALQNASDALAAPEANIAIRALAEDMSAALWIDVGQAAKAYRCFVTDDSLLAPRRRMARIAQRARVDHALGRDPRRLFRAALAVYERAADDNGRIRVEIELAAYDPGASRDLKALHDRARELGFDPLRAFAAGKRALAMSRSADGSAAANEEILEWTRYSESLIDAGGVSTAVRLIDLLSDCAAAYSACGCAEDERRCLNRAVEWLEAAKSRTPAAYRPSLLRRHERLIARSMRAGSPGVLL